MSRWRSDMPHAIDADRLAETLDFSLSSVRKHQVGVALQLITDTPADIDLPWPGHGFQPGSNIDTITVDILIVGNHIASIYANAKSQAAIGSDPGVARGQFMLDLECAIHRFDCAVELDQEPVSSTADQTAAMLGDFRLDRVLYVIREPKVRALLGDTHQSTVTDDVRDHDSGQPPFQVWSIHPITCPSQRQDKG